MTRSVVESIIALLHRSASPAHGSEAPTIDEQLLGGACGTVIGCEEQHHLRELVRHDPTLDHLIVHRALLAFGCRHWVAAGEVAAGC